MFYKKVLNFIVSKVRDPDSSTIFLFGAALAGQVRQCSDGFRDDLNEIDDGQLGLIVCNIDPDDEVQSIKNNSAQFWSMGTMFMATAHNVDVTTLSTATCKEVTSCAWMINIFDDRAELRASQVLWYEDKEPTGVTDIGKYPIDSMDEASKAAIRETFLANKMLGDGEAWARA